MMKKTILLLALSFTTLTFMGCGNATTPNKTETPVKSLQSSNNNADAFPLFSLSNYNMKDYPNNHFSKTLYKRTTPKRSPPYFFYLKFQSSHKHFQDLTC